VTLTKEHITGSIQSQLGLSKFESYHLVESVMEIIKTTLANGEDILISGFGKFTVRGNAARRGRNPQTGEDLTSGPRRVITFKCSPALKARLNGKCDNKGHT
jgi:integration host factor subunit alpha